MSAVLGVRAGGNETGATVLIVGTGAGGMAAAIDLAIDDWNVLLTDPYGEFIPEPGPLRYVGVVGSGSVDLVATGFEVDDGGMTVRVTNVGTLATDISLSRVVPDSSAPSGWRGCALYTAGLHGGSRYYGHFIDPGMSLTFVMYPHCEPEFRSAALEYRVGNPQHQGERGPKAWWSDSAVAKPEGREYESLERRNAAPR